MKCIIRFSFLITLCCLCACAGKQQKEQAAVQQQLQQPVFTLPEIPVMLSSSQDRAEFLALHYWDNFDFKDTTYIHLPDVSEQAMVDFMDIMGHVPTSVADSAITRTLREAAAEPKMLNYFWETLSRYWYDPNSPIRNEECYIMVCRAIEGLPQADEAMRSRAMYNLRLAQKNGVGMPAADFTYTLASGKQAKLYGIRSPYTILFFYNPDCSMCAEVKKHMTVSPLMREVLEKKKVTLLAFYPDEDVELWKAHLDDMSADWINAYDRDFVVDSKQLYDLRAIPTLYLLDKDKKVLLKDVRIEDIEEYFKNNLL